MTLHRENWDPDGGPWGAPARPGVRSFLKHALAALAAVGRSPAAPGRGVAILAYHNTPADPTHAWWCDFPGHMDLLERLRWSVVPLRQAVDLVSGPRPPDVPTVAITFDDGWSTNLREAFPDLARRGWPATVFVPTSLVGRRPFVTIDELRGLNALGIEVGNHTHSHPDLARTPDSRIVHELQEATRRLTEWTGQRPAHFCYPFGLFSREARDVVAAAGFHGACSSIAGRNPPGTDRFLLRRLVIEPGETIPRFRVRLAGGYDRILRLRYARRSLSG